MPHNPVTLQDLARAAGISAAAVSLALNNRPGVSEKTRKRVQDLAARLGYRRDPALRALADRRWSKSPKRQGPNMAFLTEVSAEETPTHRALLPFIRATADSLGYGLETFAARAFPSPGALDRVMQARGIEAVLLASRGAWPGWVPEFAFENYAIAMIGSQPAPLRFHQVRMNYRQTMELVWQNVRALGYRRIGYLHLSGSPPAELDAQRLAFWLYAGKYLAGPGEFLPALNLRDRTDADLITWTTRHQPDALILVVDGLRGRVQAAGLPLPCFSLSLQNPDSTHGADVAPEALGTAAVRLLDGIYRSGERGQADAPQVLLIPARWRGSHGNASTASSGSFALTLS